MNESSENVEQFLELAHVETISGAAQDPGGGFRGFVTIIATAADGTVMKGQLDPTTLRSMALQFLETAEAAEQDAIVLTILTRDVEMEPRAAGAMVHAMRDERGKHIGPKPTRGDAETG